MGMILSKAISGVSSLAFIVVAVIAAVAAYYIKKSEKDKSGDDAKMGFRYSMIASITAAVLAVLAAIVLIV
jgi:ABC-type Fe3+ transport system permease subunit